MSMEQTPFTVEVREMPFETSIDPLHRVFRTTATGMIRSEDVNAFQQAFEDNVRRDWVATELVNLADANFRDLSTEDVVHIARRNVEFLREVEIPRPRFAIFSPGNLQFGLSRVFEAWSTGEDNVADIRVFRDLDRAERWLFAG